MIAIDPATKTGIAQQRGKIITVTTIEGSPLFQVEEIFKMLDSPREVVLIEKLAIYSKGAVNLSTLIPQAARYGYITLRLMENTNEVRPTHVSTWRSFLGVKGKTGTDKKIYCQDEIKRVTGVSVNRDEADALSILLYGLQLDFDGLEAYTIQKVKRRFSGEKIAI